jgi:hypothetical protein
MRSEHDFGLLFWLDRLAAENTGDLQCRRRPEIQCKLLRLLAEVAGRKNNGKQSGINAKYNAEQ